MEELTPLLNELAAQLGTTVDFLWGVLVRQAQIFVIIHIVYWILWIISLLIAYRVTLYLCKNLEKIDDAQYFGKIILNAIPWAIVFILGFIQLAALSDFITALLNPEYWALEKVLEFIKQEF